MRLPTSSLPGLTPQVGLARLAALNNAELGQARVPVQSILLRKKMDARVTSAFTRVFDALLPAHDGSAIVFRRREFISLLGAAAAPALHPLIAGLDPAIHPSLQEDGCAGHQRVHARL